MPNVKDAYEKIDNLEEKLRLDLRKAFFLEQNFQAYADFSRECLAALGKEIRYDLVEQAVRDSAMMQKIALQLDKVKYSYNDLVREIATIRRDGIAKSMISDEGCDEAHSINSALLKYGIDPKEGMFSKATYIIAQTRKSAIEQKYSQQLVVRKEWITPNNMSVADFIFLVNGYATSTSKNISSKNSSKKEEVHANV